VSCKTFFVQECPTCGRRLHIRVEYLGKSVVCQHCRGKFFAFDSAGRKCALPESVDTLLRRVDELLGGTPPGAETAARSPNPR